jgi:hypothetical protein
MIEEAVSIFNIHLLISINLITGEREYFGVADFRRQLC